MWNKFKVNNKDTRTTLLTSFWCLYCWLWMYFTPCSSVSIIKFEIWTCISLSIIKSINEPNIKVGPLMSCFSRSLLNYMPYAPSCPICLMAYVLLCLLLWLLSYPTSLVPCMLSFLMCLVPYLLCTSRALCLTYLVPYVFSCLKCLTCSCISRVLYLACS